MRAQLSIVIPTLNSADELPETLAWLMEGIHEGLVRELIISDGGSTDASLQMADDVGAIVVRGASGRGGQLRRGADAAGGAWLLFLHADTHLPDDWTKMIAGHMQASEKAACFRLAFRARGFGPWFTAKWANLRTGMGLPYGDQALLISRALYDRVAGYPDIALMEDVAMAKALRGRIVTLPGTVTTGAGRYIKDGWFLRGARNLSILLRYKLGASPDDLARWYNR